MTIAADETDSDGGSGSDLRPGGSFRCSHGQAGAGSRSQEFTSPDDAILSPGVSKQFPVFFRGRL